MKFFYHEIFPAISAVAETEVFETRTRNDALVTGVKGC